jgi:selenocysteine lyase/cysteine desulfurase
MKNFNSSYSYGNYFRSFFPYFKDDTKIYLDSAATSQKPLCVIQAQMDFLIHHNANIHRTTGGLSTNLIEEVRQKTADFLETEFEEIVFGGGFTEMLCNMAMSLSQLLESGDVILLSQWEHHSNLLIWQKIASQKKCSIEYIPIWSEKKPKTEKPKTSSNQNFSQIHLTAEDKKVLTGFLLEIDKTKTDNKEFLGQKFIEKKAFERINFLDIKKTDKEIGQDLIYVLGGGGDTVTALKTIEGKQTGLLGSIDWFGFLDVLIKNKNKIKILSISETSNISGYQAPVKEIIELIKIFSSDCVSLVDASQSDKT